MIQFKNLSSINDNVISEILTLLNLAPSFQVIIVVNPELENKDGDVCFAFAENMAFINLKKDNDIPTLAHELRHIWQMEQLGAAEYEALYQEELLYTGYRENILEVDAFDWEQWYCEKYLTQAA